MSRLIHIFTRKFVKSILQLIVILFEKSDTSQMSTSHPSMGVSGPLVSLAGSGVGDRHTKWPANRAGPQEGTVRYVRVILFLGQQSFLK